MTSSPAKDGVVAQPLGGQRASAAGWLRGSVRFWSCLLLLIAAAVGLKATARSFGWYFRKEAVPLKTSLSHFDVGALGPRYERHWLSDHIAPMSEDMVDSLGTEEYFQVFVADTLTEAHDPAHIAHVFVSYYTGKPDMVPHVPEECWIAGGYDMVGGEEVRIPVAGVGAPEDEVPMQVLEFKSRQQEISGGREGGTATVMYFFHANGGYATTRTQVRASMLNPLQRYGYYAKIEISFRNAAGVLAGTEASIEAVAPLLARLLPALFENHLDLAKFRAERGAEVLPGE